MKTIKVCSKCLRNNSETEFKLDNMCVECQTKYNRELRVKELFPKSGKKGEREELCKAFGRSILPPSAYIHYLESEQRIKDKAEADLYKTVERFRPRGNE